MQTSLRKRLPWHLWWLSSWSLPSFIFLSPIPKLVCRSSKSSTTLALLTWWV